jgi:hypothetical protein
MSVMLRFSIAVVAMVVLLPATGRAQVYQWRTPAPPATAQYAEWQFNNEPIFVNGLVYYPTRETRFFDGQIMVQVAVHLSVPVYADVLLEPHSVIYVPVGRNLMRGYERRREGEIAGTQGSRTPAFPVDVASSIETRRVEPYLSVSAVPDIAPPPPPPIPAQPPLANVERVSAPVNIPTRIETAQRPMGANGVWLAFNGARWYSRGPAAVFEPNRFTSVGEYRGFPVYREKNGSPDEIWVAVVKDGPVAPYVRR